MLKEYVHTVHLRVFDSKLRENGREYVGNLLRTFQRPFIDPRMLLGVLSIINVGCQAADIEEPQIIPYARIWAECGSPAFSI